MNLDKVEWLTDTISEAKKYGFDDVALAAFHTLGKELGAEVVETKIESIEDSSQVLNSVVYDIEIQKFIFQKGSVSEDSLLASDFRDILLAEFVPFGNSKEMIFGPGRNKVTLIRSLRKSFNLGLVDAKNLAENIMSKLCWN